MAHHDPFIVRLPSGTAELETLWIEPDRIHTPLIVFLHEGLGSIDAWQGWPHTLCNDLQCRGLVFSRQGYGRSRPEAQVNEWPVNYLHREATEVVPRILKAVGVDPAVDRPIILGHSDGGTVALHYAAAYPELTRAVIAIAPHVFSKGVNFELINRLRHNYEDSALQRYLARMHDHPDKVFWRWSNRWSSPEFQHWDITACLRDITSPLLAIQGRNDQYSTLEQLYEIERHVPQTELMILDDCRHTPHLEYPAQLAQRLAAFLS